MSSPEEWTWFCGTNTSLENFTWTGKNIINNVCIVDGLSSVFQSVFICAFSLALLVLKCCSRYGHINTPYLIRYPGHFIRWMLSALLLIVLLASVGEGALTSMTYGSPSNGLPHLYIAPTFSFVCVIITLVVNQHMELWRRSKLSFLLLVYWLGCVVIETGQLLALKEEEEVDVDIVRFDVVVIRLAVFCALAIVEMNVIRIKVGTMYQTGITIKCGNIG